MLSMLFLVPCAMPVAAYAETTANEDMSVIKTEAYTAVVPKNGIVVSSGPEQFTQTSRLLDPLLSRMMMLLLSSIMRLLYMRCIIMSFKIIWISPKRRQWT